MGGMMGCGWRRVMGWGWVRARWVSYSPEGVSYSPEGMGYGMGVCAPANGSMAHYMNVHPAHGEGLPLAGARMGVHAPGPLYPTAEKLQPRCRRLPRSTAAWLKFLPILIFGQYPQVLNTDMHIAIWRWSSLCGILRHVSEIHWRFA